VAHGTLAARHAELVFDGDVSAFVKCEIARLQPPAQPTDVYLARAGANAFYAVHRAVSHIQRARGRTVWVQFGWLYLDTGCVLDKFGAEPIKIPNLSDLDALEALLSARRDIAAIVCETPNNPLLQSCDFKRLSALAHQHDVLLVIDPTVSSIANVPALRYADVMVTSLTKYAAREADVMIGAVAICPDSPYADELRAELAQHIAAPYARDLQRLAHEMQGMSEFVAQLNANARAVHEFLLGHPCVYDVRYAGYGAMMSFSVRKPLAKFFDGLPLVKAASFGAEFSIISPFMYLAHYDLVSTADGRAHLAALDIDPNLLRLSVGLEPVDQLIAAFSVALM
jgi:cystathionine gamma-synthase